MKFLIKTRIAVPRLMTLAALTMACALAAQNRNPGGQHGGFGGGAFNRGGAFNGGGGRAFNGGGGRAFNGGGQPSRGFGSDMGRTSLAQAQPQPIYRQPQAGSPAQNFRQPAYGQIRQGNIPPQNFRQQPGYGQGQQPYRPSQNSGPAQNYNGQPAYARPGNGYATQPARSGAGAQQGDANSVHLGPWMQQHSNLNPQQQQRALQNEPGFNRLPPQMQQRMQERLNHLNSMPPQQRQRMLQGGEALERLNPQQRGDVRSAMGQLGAMRADRQQAVARSFRELRNMPVPQRNALLNSPQYRQQFTDEERGTLGNLLSVSPLLPPTR